MAQKRYNYKKKLHARGKAALRKRKRRFLKKIRGLMIWIVLILILCLCGFAGYDYYQNKNFDRTMQLIQDTGEYLQTVPGQMDHLVKEGKRRFYELTGTRSTTTAYSFSIDDIPAYSGSPYVEINGNIPYFDEDEQSSGAFEYYSELDYLGRCGLTEAMVTREIMPTEAREAIGMVKPTGWHTVKYDVIADRYLYNRCHLIAFELAGENANEKNLITGTRYMNVEGMLPFENMVAQYVRRTNGKVIYRSTPVFVGDELVARGVHMEALSIDSNEICFNVFVYNVQPGVGIDYANGNSWEE